MDKIEILPNFRKRVFLIPVPIALAILVALTSTFMSPLFILYFSISIGATIYCVFRLFDRKPVLTLSPEGMISNMTPGGKEIGLVSWAEITDIREAKTFGFLKSIDIHTKANAGNSFLMQLASDETSMSHKQLLALVLQQWDKYKLPNAQE